LHCTISPSLSHSAFLCVNSGRGQRPPAFCTVSRIIILTTEWRSFLELDIRTQSMRG
jgi:hypothetical protein